MSRIVRPAIAFALMLVAIVAVVLWSIADTRPAWYRPPDAADARVVEVADTVEHRVLEEVHRIRDESGTWTVRLRDAQLNAWLAARLPKWLERERNIAWPDGVGTPQLRFAASGVELGVEILEQRHSRVVVLRTRPRAEDGRLTLRLDGVDLGRMTIPGSFLETLARHIPAPSSDTASHDLWQQLLAGDEVELGELKLSDDRVVRLLELQLGDGTLEVTCRTVRPGGE